MSTKLIDIIHSTDFGLIKSTTLDLIVKHAVWSGDRFRDAVYPFAPESYSVGREIISDIEELILKGKSATEIFKAIVKKYS